MSSATRRISTAGTAAGTALLVLDLGRPERFLNMLRVFRPTSPMNAGSWILAGAASLSAGSAALAGAGGIPRSAGDAAGLAAGALGAPLATYPAVLVSNSAVPLWQAIRRSLPTLFASSSATAATSILAACALTEREHRAVRRLARAGALAELLAANAVERDASTVARVGKPLREGFSGALWKTSKACAARGLLVSLLPGRRTRALSAVLGTAASLGIRFAIFHAGVASARDPRATFRQQRAGRGGAEVTGAAAVTGPGTRASGPDLPGARTVGLRLR